MRTSSFWRRHAPTAALAAAFLTTVILGRSLSARPTQAAESPRAVMVTLPSLAKEIGVTPLVTLVGRDTIVRISEREGKRLYSVFDRAGAPLATRLSRTELARQFPKIRLEEMRDVASGFAADSEILADTPDPSPDH